MSTPRITTILTTAALAAALPPAAAGADSLVTAAPGAKALAGGGGYLAWSAPTPDGRWQLTVRAPGGTVSHPAVAAFARPVRVSIGSTAPYGASRRLVATYARDGDAYELDLARGAETRLAALSTRAEETLVAVGLGRYVVVRRGLGTYSYGPGGRAVRLTKSVPSQIAMSQSRVASIEGGRIVIRRLSGHGRALVAGRNLADPSSLWLTRYRAGYATYTGQAGAKLYGTRRFAGSGGPYTLRVIGDPWSSPGPIDGIVVDGHGEPGYYLDADGVERFSPTPFHGR